MFYLGTHLPQWLYRVTDVPLFISYRRLERRVSEWGPVTTSWALDSGAYSEIATHGRWRTTPKEYASNVSRYAYTMGRLCWAAPMDWPTEPIATSRSGKSVREHQRRTVGNYVDLRSIDTKLPIIPVVQGQTVADYLRCVDMYATVGVDLRKAKLVGVGSVCRRQRQTVVADIFRELRAAGLRLHGFGLSSHGVSACRQYICSADSMAWSYRARMGFEGEDRGKDCTHRVCNNCLPYALEWREKILTRIAT